MTFSVARRAPDSAVRARVERATGADLRAARVHTGPAVDRRALALGARAFTVGRDVHLAAGADEHTLAHELTHVAQQGAADVAGADVAGAGVAAGGGLAVRPTGDAAEREADAVAAGGAPGRVTRVAPAVQRKLAQYEVTGTTLDPAELAKWGGASYWEQKVFAAYQTFMPVARLRADPEERDAVLSAAWSEHLALAPLKAATTRVVTIAKRVAPTSKALAYQLTFEPAAKPGDLPTLKIALLAEGDADVAAVSAAQTTTAASVPADYATRDFADLQLEPLRARAKDPLGAITGLAAVPAAERIAVKFAIYQYFVAGKARDTEIDAIVPHPDGKQRLLYTLRFAPKTNDVAVERLGVEGTGALTLDPAARGLDVRRTQGFDPAFAADAAKLKAWLATRYPGVAPTGADAPAMIADVNTKMNADAGTPAWFKKNYAIDVLDATTAATRMEKTHGEDAAQTAGMKDFAASELKRVEWAVETLGDAMLGVVKGASLGRQAVRIERVVGPPAKRGAPPTITYVKADKRAGEAFMTGPARTVLLFDRMTLSDASMFVGGATTGGGPGVSLRSTFTIVHELGHFVGWSGGATTVLAAFNAKFIDARSKLKTAPVTSYAATAPTTEFFPEAFALFHEDPEWMRTNVPDMFAWFQALAKTGAPP